MDAFTALLATGVVVGGATYVVAAVKARAYVDGKSVASHGNGMRGVRGVAWIALAALGALFVFTSFEALARVTEEKVELIRRRAIMASQDKTLSVYRDGFKQLQATAIQARGRPATARVAKQIEKVLAEIHEREKAIR
ncbi:MAG TPA: hypothetical protein VED18_06530 [Candidatus Sulfotelmatobacter sp.]|nr:hypothetical protein [Candidatus Sulfotelmatobacter sp.]